MPGVHQLLHWTRKQRGPVNATLGLDTEIWNKGLNRSKNESYLYENKAIYLLAHLYKNEKKETIYIKK
jgi:hypothetical protein